MVVEVRERGGREGGFQEINNNTALRKGTWRGSLGYGGVIGGGPLELLVVVGGVEEDHGEGGGVGV